VLRLYRDPDRLAERLATLRLLTRTEADIAAQAQRLLPALRQALLDWPVNVAVESTLSQIGSGSLPVDRLPSAALVIRPKLKKGGVLHEIEAALRGLPFPSSAASTMARCGWTYAAWMMKAALPPNSSR